MEENCIFCKIIKGELPSYKIYEDEYVLCFLDISQASEGHTLIVPKKHFENLFDVDQETLNHMAQAVKIVTNLLKEKLGVTDVNLLNNSGTNAGQTVMHLHFHIIPRKEGDNINFSFQENEPNFDKLSQTQKKLVENKLQ